MNVINNLTYTEGHCERSEGRYDPRPPHQVRGPRNDNFLSTFTIDPRIERFLAELKQRHPNIRTHEENDDEWWQEGMRMLRSGDLEGAEKKFEHLILAEPEHHDGYEGLALVCREKGNKHQALLLIDHALALAMGFFEEGTLDQEILDEIEEEKRKILDMR